MNNNDHYLKFTPYFDTELQKEKQEIFDLFQPAILFDHQQTHNPKCKLFIKEKEEKKN